MYKFKINDIVGMTENAKVYNWYTDSPLIVLQTFQRPTVRVIDILEQNVYEIFIEHLELDIITSRKLKIEKIKERLNGIIR